MGLFWFNSTYSKTLFLIFFFLMLTHTRACTGNWLSDQRRRKRGTRPVPLTDEQDALLQALVDRGVYCVCVCVCDIWRVFTSPSYIYFCKHVFALITLFIFADHFLLSCRHVAVDLSKKEVQHKKTETQECLVVNSIILVLLYLVSSYLFYMVAIVTIY